MISAEFNQHIRFALQHLFEINVLDKGPAQALRPWLSQINEPSDLTAGQRLHQVLLRAIERMKPSETLDHSLPRHRSYLILKHRYIDGLPIQQLEVEFNISSRQFRRENHKAVEELMLLLWELSPQAARDAIRAAPSSEEEMMRPPLTDFTLNVSAQNLLDVVVDAAHTLSVIISNSQTQVTADIPSDLPQVSADRVVLRLAIIKLLRIAIAHCPQHAVLLRAAFQSNAINLTLHGVQGISADDMAYDEAAQLFALAEGDIELYGASDDPAQHISVRLSIHRVPTVLVIDDDPAMPRIIQRFLGTKPIKVISCDSSTDVVKLAREAQPILILLDVLMPTRDGWEVLQELKANPDTHQIPLAVCSIWDERELALSLGADLFFQKPIDRAVLLECVEKHMAPTNSHA